VGDPVVLLPGYARGFKADLLVVGAHRHSAFEHLITEMKGEEIAECAGVPVMFAAPGEKSRFDRILVAIDLSPGSITVLDCAQLLAQVDNCAVRVVHVHGPRQGAAHSLSPRAQEAQREVNRKRLEELVRESPLGERIQPLLLSGHPGRAIRRAAAAWDADLIVTGLNRYGVRAQPRLGRTPRYLLHHTGRYLVVVPG
jgi:nucleotide-binding universal stress UspA family protein